MLLTYLDESYDRDRFYIAALICPEAEAIPLADELDAVVDKAAGLGVISNAELHGYDLFHGKGDWLPTAKMTRARIGVYSDALDAIASREVRIILRGLDVPALRRRYSHPNPPHEVVLQHVLERVNELAAGDEALALIIADEVPEQDEHRAAFSRYRRSGTPGYRGTTLDRLVDTIHFAPSHRSRLLQAVDLVAFLHHRLETVREADARAARANDQLWAAVRRRVVHNYCWTP